MRTCPDKDMNFEVATARASGTGGLVGVALMLTMALGLAACGTVELGETPPEVNACRPSQSFFVTEVWPGFLAKTYSGRRCSDADCHASARGRELVVTPPTSAPAVPLPPDWAALYRSVSQQMLCTNVSASPLLARVDGRQTHGGGKLIEPDRVEATLIKMWVTAP